MAVACDHAATVGNTPLVELKRLARDYRARIFAKLEMRNPCGSVKDRLGVALIDEAEREGRLGPGMTLIEATGGNTGIGLAFVAAIRGYRLVLTMPEVMSAERVSLLRQLGAEIVLTPGILMWEAIAKADALARECSNAVRLNQFMSPANPAIHRTTTGPEIWHATKGEVDVFVSSVGTGGTIVGVAEALKALKPSVRAVAVEPSNAAVLSGRPAGQHAMPGIGVGFVPPLFKRDLIDEIISVSDQDAYASARRLAREEGILSGPSSGAALAAAMQIAQLPVSVDQNIVVLLADTGERYLSSALFTGA